MEDDGPSLPSNYVTLLHLKERWLQQQSAKSNPHHHQSDCQLNVKPKDDSASKIPKEAAPRGRNHRRIVNRLKPDATLPDSASRIPNEAVPRGGTRHRVVNQLKSEVAMHDSASKIAKESVPRARTLHRVVNQLKPEVAIHDSASKTVVQVADNHPTVEKQELDTDQSNSELSTTKNSSRDRNPRSVTDQNQTGGSTPPSEPEPVHEKKQHRYIGERRYRNQKIWGPKDKTPPLAQKVDDKSHNDFRRDDVVEAVAAAVKEIKVSGVSRRRWGSGRFHGDGPPIAVKKGQMTAVWVKKGESAPN